MMNLKQMLQTVKREKAVAADKKPESSKHNPTAKFSLTESSDMPTFTDISQYCINNAPALLYYVPEYVSRVDEQAIVEQIYSQTNTEKWEFLAHSNRRLQKIGGDVTATGLQNQKPLPAYLDALAEKLHQKSHITPLRANHVLLNEYPPHTGIMPHTDGPLYYPFVCTISLLSPCLLKFYTDYQQYSEGQGKAVLELLIEERSLVCFSQDLYSKHLHTIADTAAEYVYLQIEKQTENVPFKIVKSSVANFFQTRLYRERFENKCGDLQQLIDSGLLLPVSNQQVVAEQSTIQYNYAIEIRREKRLSLTIRHVPIKQ